MPSFEPRGASVRAVVRVAGQKRSATFDTLAEAQAWAARQEARKGPVGGIALGDMLEEYLEADRTDSARWNKLRILKWLQDPIAKLRLRAIVTHDVDQWIERRLGDVSPATVNRELNLLSGTFTWAVKARRWIEVNPCHGARRPALTKARGRPLLAPAEIEAIKIATGYDRDPELRTLTARVGACFLLALETGMRSGEILRLQPQDYWRDKRTVHVAAREAGGRKTARSGRLDSSRWVPLTTEAVRLLDQLGTRGEYIVGMTDAQRDALWRKAVRQAGVADLHFHDTKHEAATRLARFLDVLELSHAIGTKDVRLLRDTYYVSDASRAAARLPSSLVGC